MPDTGPIGPPPKDYDKYHIPAPQGNEPIRGDSRNHPTFQDKKNSIVAAYLRQCFQKIASLFTKRFQGKGLSQIDEELWTHLSLLKTQLEILKTEDASEDISFFSKLCSIGQKIEEDLSSFPKSHSVAAEVRIFFEEFKKYPLEAEHSLGYYLLHPPAGDWLPFPYMSIIQTLFKNHQEKKAESILTKWTLILDQLITQISDEDTPSHEE